MYKHFDSLGKQSLQKWRTDRWLNMSVFVHSYQVRQVAIKAVLNQQAYLLFYAKQKSSKKELQVRFVVSISFLTAMMTEL